MVFAEEDSDGIGIRAGPAGKTGKTESTKDLGSALAKVVYVFNCSPELVDYNRRDASGIYLKDRHRSSGRGGCTADEFNRLIPRC